MRIVRASDLLNVGTALAELPRLPAIAYLRGARAALACDPPDAATARQLIDQALAILDPPKEPRDGAG